MKWTEGWMRKKFGMLTVNMKVREKIGIVKRLKPRKAIGMLNRVRLVKIKKG
jgi:hypothetical protein